MLNPCVCSAMHTEYTVTYNIVIFLKYVSMGQCERCAVVTLIS